MRKDLKIFSSSTSILLAVMFMLSACTTTSNNEAIDYKSQGEKKIPNLSVPPDLSTTTTDRRYSVADSSGTATLSQYNSTTKVKKEEAKTTVTPEQLGFHIERDGQRRWIVASKPAEELYPKVKSFWEDTGFLILMDSPVTGIMETDWAENRAKIPDDMVRRFLGNTLDSIYSTGERDKFRTRLEKNTAGKTEIYVTHRGAEEKLVSQGGSAQAESSMWTTRAADPELEAEMLTRMLVYLGADYQSAKATVASTAGASAVRTSRVTNEGDSAVLTFNQSFDKAWREVGLALDRSNFTVEDRDRSKGIYYVRYVNPKDVNTKDSGGWFSGWFKSSKVDELKKAKRYQVVVKTNGNVTRVNAFDETGAIVKGDVDSQILKSIDEQVSY
jgi:outer membrane protein assembly factor BamC